MARRTTDLFWLLLFLCAVAVQVFFAALALYRGIQSDFEGASFDEVLQNITAQHGWMSRAQDAVTNWIELRPKNLRLESQGIILALGTSAACSGAFLLLLAFFPVHLVVYLVSLGFPVVLMLLGAFAISGAAPAVMLGIEAHFGYPLVLVGILVLIATSFAWSYLRLGIAVLRCSSAFLRARPAIGAYPLLFGVLHIAGLVLWGLAVLGMRSSLDDQLGEDLDWQSQFGTASAMLLCFLWGNSFVTGLSTFAVAFAASHWYGRGPPDAKVGSLHGVMPIKVGLRYHAGSVALGSLLLALVRTLNVMLWWAEKAQDEATAVATGAVQNAAGFPARRPPARPPSLLRSLRNFAAEVLEVVATWASKQAFVQIAISGCPFAQGAVRAGQLAMKAPAGFLMVESLSAIFQRACELILIGVAVLVASSFGLEGLSGLGPVMLSAWLAAESLLHPYSVATTTILHCSLLDKEPSSDSKQAVPKEVLELQRTMEELSGTDGSFVQHYR